MAGMPGNAARLVNTSSHWMYCSRLEKYKHFYHSVIHNYFMRSLGAWECWASSRQSPSNFNASLQDMLPFKADPLYPWMKSSGCSQRKNRGAILWRLGSMGSPAGISLGAVI